MFRAARAEATTRTVGITTGRLPIGLAPSATFVGQRVGQSLEQCFDRLHRCHKVIRMRLNVVIELGIAGHEILGREAMDCEQWSGALRVV